VSDCPVGCGWRYDPSAAPVCAKRVGDWLPVVWDGSLHRARGSDAPVGRWAATGAHVCFAHWLEPEVLLLGPVEARPL
jgi:hypothetical protein